LFFEYPSSSSTTAEASIFMYRNGSKTTIFDRPNGGFPIAIGMADMAQLPSPVTEFFALFFGIHF